MKTLSCSVSAEAFSDDMRSKLTSALQSVFGETAKIEFAESEETPEEKEKREKEEKERQEGKDKEMMSLRSQVKELQTQQLASQTEARKQAEAADKIAKEFQSYKDDIQKREAAAHTQEIEQLIEKGKSDGRITPANEDQVRVMLTRADTSKIVKFTKAGKEAEATEWEIVKEFVATLPQQVVMHEMSFSGDSGRISGGQPRKLVHKGEEYTVLDVEVDSAARSYAQEHNVPYEEALLVVSRQSVGK